MSGQQMGRKEWESSVRWACRFSGHASHTGNKDFLLILYCCLICLFPNIQAIFGYHFFEILF